MNDCVRPGGGGEFFEVFSLWGNQYGHAESGGSCPHNVLSHMVADIDAVLGRYADFLCRNQEQSWSGLRMPVTRLHKGLEQRREASSFAQAGNSSEVMTLLITPTW